MPDFVVPPSFAALLRTRPLRANQTICLLPDYGGYRRGLLLSTEPISSRSFRVFFTDDQRWAFHQMPTLCTPSDCYSSLHCFYIIRFKTYRGSYITGRAALSSVFWRETWKGQKSRFPFPQLTPGQVSERRGSIPSSIGQTTISIASARYNTYLGDPQITWPYQQMKNRSMPS